MTSSALARKGIVLAEHEAEDEKKAVGGDEPHGRAKLREHAEAGFPSRWRILDGKQCRPAPLSTEAKTLAEAEDAEQERRDPSGLRIGGQEGDRHGGAAHQHQRPDQRGLAPDAVSEMAEGHGPDGPRDEGDGERRVGRHQLRGCRFRGEEQLRKDERCGGGVYVEIVELDRSADEAGGEHARGGRTFGCCR